MFIAPCAPDVFVFPQSYLERAVSPSVTEVFISALSTLFTVVPSMRNKFSKKLGRRVLWDHVLCALNWWNLLLLHINEATSLTLRLHVEDFITEYSYSIIE